MIHFGAKSQTEYGPDIKINCPRCHGRDVEAKTGVVTETTTILFVPVSKSCLNLVKCLNCGVVLRSRVSIMELPRLSVEQLDSVLRIRIDFVGVFLAFAALFVSAVPIFGILLSVVAILINRKSATWVKAIGWVALALAVAGDLLMMYRLRQATP